MGMAAAKEGKEKRREMDTPSEGPLKPAGQWSRRWLRSTAVLIVSGNVSPAGLAYDEKYGRLDRRGTI